nr:hypothetical protein Iba_chr11eCG9070 [Ipomoea batatas]
MAATEAVVLVRVGSGDEGGGGGSGDEGDGGAKESDKPMSDWCSETSPTDWFQPVSPSDWFQRTTMDIQSEKTPTPHDCSEIGKIADARDFDSDPLFFSSSSSDSSSGALSSSFPGPLSLRTSSQFLPT